MFCFQVESRYFYVVLLGICLGFGRVVAGCHLHVTNVNVSRQSIKSGFHRNIDTFATITVAESEPQQNVTCSLLIKEHFPAGVFIDPYEIKNAEEFGGPRVVFEGEIDVEKPAFQSSNLSVDVISTPHKIITPGELTLGVSLPVHLRYHTTKSDGKEHITVHIQQAEIFLVCSRSTLGEKENKCSINLEERSGELNICENDESIGCPSYSLNSYVKTGDLVFKVPVRNMKHTSIVMIMTPLSMIGSVVFILWEIVCGMKSNIYKRR